MPRKSRKKSSSSSKTKSKTSTRRKRASTPNTQPSAEAEETYTIAPLKEKLSENDYFLTWLPKGLGEERPELLEEVEELPPAPAEPIEEPQIEVEEVEEEELEEEEPEEEWEEEGEEIIENIPESLPPPPPPEEPSPPPPPAHTPPMSTAPAIPPPPQVEQHPPKIDTATTIDYRDVDPFPLFTVYDATKGIEIAYLMKLKSGSATKYILLPTVSELVKDDVWLRHGFARATIDIRERGEKRPAYLVPPGDSVVEAATRARDAAVEALGLDRGDVYIKSRSDKKHL